MKIVVGSYNIHFRLSLPDIETDLNKLLETTEVSVLGLQEVGKDDRIEVLERICQQRGWEYYRPDAIPYQAQDPIMWNDKMWESVQLGSHRLNDEVWAEDGAGSARIESKWATWVVLRHRETNKRIAVINWHAPATVEDPKKPMRQAALRQCTASADVLARDLSKEVDATFIAGDMNVNYRRKRVNRIPGFPVAVFHKSGFMANWSYGRLPLLGTHTSNGLFTTLPTGTRLIDYVFANVPCVRSRILRGYVSDHRPVLAIYRF